MSSTGRIQQVVAQFRTQLDHHVSSAERALTSAYLRTLASIQPRLDALYKEIAAKQEAGETIPPSWIYEQNRLQSIKALIAQQMARYGNITHNTVAQLQRIGATLGIQAGHEQLMATVPPGIHYSFGTPKAEAISDLVGALQPDSPLYEMFDKFGVDAAQNAGDALVRGLTLGNNPREVARDVQQALGVSRNRALVTSRTECLRAYRSSAIAVYNANSDICAQWVWTAALNIRTCPACIAMNGTKHPLDEEMQSHPQCRCAPVPLTRSWSDILGIDDIPDAQVDIPSGVDWFDDQDEATQRAILGSDAKYEAFSRGDFNLSDIVSISHDPDWGRSIGVKSLKELTK